MPKSFFLFIALFLVFNNFATYRRAMKIVNKENKKSLLWDLQLSIVLSLIILGYALYIQEYKVQPPLLIC